ncbi:MAG: cytochrome C oxidase Cbb3, partial [Gammaproteobacteria bacterium]|nr:cytochrome C oxidase Cbb3 [Gammaproteobacteria bacterium]
MSTTTATATAVAATRGTDTARSGYYNVKVVRQFTIAIVVWVIVGMAVGLLIAAQLYWQTIV